MLTTMHSGSDSNESQKYANWALNPSAFQNVSGEHVDWAALAQQWIMMKEAGPPPIPGEHPVVINKKKVVQEGGEAEMDVENEKEAPPPPVWGTEPPAPGESEWGWNSQPNQNWSSWSNSWAPPSVVPPPAPNISNLKNPLLPTPSTNNSVSEPPESSSDNAVPFGSYNTGDYRTPNWNNTSAPPHKHIKPHNKRYSKVNVPIRAPAPMPPITVPVEPFPAPVQPPTIDTVKRKQLPAWIREGLEKMEKEKLKQMEKEKEKEERGTYVEQVQPSEDTIQILKSAMKERQKSRFESDEEHSNEDNKKPKIQKIVEPPPLTQEELMLKVRRTMTEILLNVTNRHIETVCREELQRYLKKRKAPGTPSAPSGAVLRGRLGLGIYGGDDSGSSSDEESDIDSQRDSRDSDDELKDTIKRKMSDFQKTEKEIEDKLEEAERRKAESASRSPSPDSNDNDSQVEARTQDRKHTQHRDSRQVSPPKTTQKRRTPSTSSQESDYSNNRSKNSRRSSSTDSKDSYKKSSKRRSVTPEKRHRSTSSRWSKSPSRRSTSRKDSNGSKRDSGSARKKSASSRRSRSSSYSRSRRSRSSSYKKSKRSRSREKSKRSRSSSRSRYDSRRSPSSSRSYRKRRRRSRSRSSSRGKRSHRH